MSEHNAERNSKLIDTRIATQIRLQGGLSALRSMTDKELLSIPNFGKKSVNAFRERHGYASAAEWVGG